MSKDKKKIGELLIEAGLIDEFQLQSSLSYQKSWGGRLGSILLRKGFVTEHQMAEVISRQYDIPCISLAELDRPPDTALKLLKIDIAKKFGVFPLGMDGKNLQVAVADPTDLKTLDDLGFLIGVRIKPVLALESEILRAIETNYDGKYSQGPFIISDESLHREHEKLAPPVSPAAHERGRGVLLDNSQPLSPPGSESYNEQFLDAPAPAVPVTANPAEDLLLNNQQAQSRRAAPEKPKAEASQRAVIESIVDLLVAKGVFTKEELMQRIRSKMR